jgi:hypothetical protein
VALYLLSFPLQITVLFYLRAYVNFATLPSAENKILGFRASGGFGVPQTNISIDNTGALRLYNNTTTQIGSASSPLSTGQWYRIELKIDKTPAGGSQIVEAKIDGVVFATASNLTVNQAQSIVIGGNLNSEAQTTGNWFFDDIAVNDSTTSNQNTYPGPGHIIHLKPNAAGDVNGFLVQVGGTAGSSNNFTRVNEVTPNDATSYNASAALNAEDLFNCDDSGIGSSDLVRVVSVGVRMANLVSADATAAIKLEIEKTGSGTKSQSADIIPNSTSFATNAAANPRNYPLTTYQDPDGANWTQTTLDSMQIGYIEDVANTQSIAISAIWALVDYLPVGETTTSTSTSSSTSTTTTSTSTTTTSTSTTTTTSTSTSTTTTSTSTTTTTSTSTSTTTTSTSTSTTTTTSTSTSTTTTAQVPQRVLQRQPRPAQRQRVLQRQPRPARLQVPAQPQPLPLLLQRHQPRPARLQQVLLLQLQLQPVQVPQQQLPAQVPQRVLQRQPRPAQRQRVLQRQPRPARLQVPAQPQPLPLLLQRHQPRPARLQQVLLLQLQLQPVQVPQQQLPAQVPQRVLQRQPRPAQRQPYLLLLVLLLVHQVALQLPQLLVQVQAQQQQVQQQLTLIIFQ